MTPAVFLDRDGTMVHDAGYLSRIEELQWYPWTIDAVRLLNRAGFLVCVTSNQGGIGLGLFPETFVRDVQAAMTEALEAGGARIDAWFHCPHHPGAVLPQFRLDCECRKPKPGMIRQAAERFSIDLAKSFVVGDKASDVGLAKSAGARGVLVRTGAGAAELARSAHPSTTLRADPSTTLRAGPSTTLRADPSTTLRAGPSTTLRADGPASPKLALGLSSEGGAASPKLALGLSSEGGAIGADHVAADLMGAATWILEQSGFPRVTA